MVPTVVQLPAGKALTVRAAADAFLGSLGNPNTVRNYRIGVGETAERIGGARPLGLWRMLYETAARSEEILGANIEGRSRVT